MDAALFDRLIRDFTASAPRRNTVADIIEAWTSTHCSGAPVVSGGGGNCDHWNDGTGIFTAVVGSATASHTSWSAKSPGTTFCFELRRLNCFQQS